MATYQEQQKDLINTIERQVSAGSFSATTVAMRNDFVTSQEISLTAVSFVPPEINRVISESIIEPLRQVEPGHYFLPPESRHVTIKNVRAIHHPPNFTDGDIEKVAALFAKIIPEHQSFSFHLQGLLLFPTSISLMGYCDERLKYLVQALDSGLRDIGVPDDKKYLSDEVFFGNITLCRLTASPSLAFIAKIKGFKNVVVGSLPLTEISLISCNPVCHPSSRKIIAQYSLKI
ncbi:hypothetical protein HY933_01730 [Candidatus Falkowbacteria bacterium]|nr:hypothetical protein [Candidatus Falkowbacteria bacterium]